MANALIVHKDRLPQSRKALSAAQYVRMSTDYQKYSIENQAVVIAAFAQLHKLTIVRTYRDEGESGLQIKNRMGLMQLIKDVQSGSAEFAYILVYDVSRWAAFKMSMRVPTTSLSASGPASKLHTAPSSSTMTEA